MRKPSGRVLRNVVDIFLPVDGRSGTGLEYTYASTPTYGSVPCTVQPQAQQGDVGGLARLTQVNYYDVLFSADYVPPIRAKLLWTDDTGTVHNLIVETSWDHAGRGAAFTVSCVERI